MATEDENGKQVKIGIDDIDMCVRILEMFMDRYRTVQDLLSQLAENVKQNKSLEEKIAEMVLRSKYQPQEIDNMATQNVELTEEEKQRLEQLKKKYLE